MLKGAQRNRARPTHGCSTSHGQFTRKDPFENVLKGAQRNRARPTHGCSTSHGQFTRKDPFDGITELDVEDAALESLITDASDTDAIDVEID